MYNSLWLNYKKLSVSDDFEKNIADCLCNVCFVSFDENNPVFLNAKKEIETAFSVILDRKINFCSNENEMKNGLFINFTPEKDLGKEGYHVFSTDKGYSIEAGGYNGLLYGIFRFIELLRLGKLTGNVDEKVIPDNPLRMLNHWDNMPGDIERGYSGNSFFFEDNKVLVNDRTVMYARAVSSVGINAVVINNVNVKGEASYLISEKHYEDLRNLSEIFNGYGISLFVSINYALPMEYGIETADPLDERVISWWKERCSEIYENVPSLGGFLVKADSEGRPGPFTYGRNQADGANMLAKAIAPFGGIIIWRCFVYNCRQDWRDTKTDRARAGYDYFHALDGQFEDNVVLQIKNGPMDFQVREPVSPLFGGMEHTNQILEVQIAQEYTGQQRHVCYLIPWFKEVLSFNTHMNEASVADIVSGRAMGNRYAGMAAVCNTGNDFNWTGHDLAGANLYGFGKLSFNTSLSSEEIAYDWARLYMASAMGEESFKKINGDRITDVTVEILMKSWPAYEKYNAPLGIGWMVVPNNHYGPDVDGYEYSVWGTYHKADCRAIGIDRTEKGTGFTTQYRKENAELYSSADTCPEELLLFFHRMPYNYILRSGKTIIQHIYDTHFEGAEDVEYMSGLWNTLKGLVNEDVFERVTARFEHQLMHSKEWRDVINSYFYRKTLIEDEKGRELY
ncbi:MAG: alpha-glucuronidase [Lachnospiraceae bacterium]|nr:alpha-glucuronidase [Lachnospiraceae bacterium]